MKMSKSIKTVETGIKARFPAMWLETVEERRALSELSEMAEGIGHQVFVWSVASGIRRRLTSAEVFASKGKSAYEVVSDEDDPGSLLEFVRDYSGPDGAPKALFVMCELDELLSEDVVLRRQFRELADDVRSRRGKHLLVLTPRSGSVPQSLERTVTLVTLSTPSREQHKGRVSRIVQQYDAAQKKAGKKLVDIDDAGIDRLVNAATGLTVAGLDRALSVAMTENGVLDSRAVDLVAKEKRQLVDGTGFLQYEEPAASLSDVGGQDLLKTWLAQRMKAFGPEAVAYGLGQPKGVLTVGPPGTGKSLGAKAASAAWGRPLIRLDVGALMGGIVGESESNTRKAISLIEAMAPCVLWIDEIEKGLSGMGSSGQTDGGTTARVFQSLLTWLNEKESAVFVYATANDPTKLPPELLRKGRLDEIFAITLPAQPEREEIFGIHIAKRDRDVAKFDVPLLAANTRGFSGAEIEQAVLDAMFAAFYDDREFGTADIITAIHATQPMARTMRERITAMREWAESRARMASSLVGQELPSGDTSDGEGDVLDILG